MPEENGHFFPVTTRGLFGLERENLRIDADGSLALTPHPAALGDKLTDPEITTDFSESQVELKTPAVPSIAQALAEEDRVTARIIDGIGDELLWPLSLPPDGLPPEKAIPIADFGPAGREKTDYRIYLSKKYGRRKQLLCGSHFNFSFLKESADGLLDSPEARSRFYLKLAAGVLRDRFFLVNLLAASPEKRGTVSYRSVRLGAEGYHNPEPLYPDYSSPEAYIASIRSLVRQKKIEGARELYQLVRIKGAGFEDLASPADADRIELRIPDLNPFFHTGINPEDLYLMHLFLLYETRADDAPFDAAAQKKADALSDEAALMEPGSDFTAEMVYLFDRLNAFALRHRLPQDYLQSLDAAHSRWMHPEQRYAEKMIAAASGKEKNAPGLLQAKQFKAFYLKTSGGCKTCSVNK
ncbi:glutathione synthase [Sporolactobacillus vineae]|uniref:glutathione synthase n=1 Tax=Sporolactobacillus vineae TaxID=444463 RepID=UPI00028A0034|nr:glutathione synthase [Sporolactobacillus vineae]